MAKTPAVETPLGDIPAVEVPKVEMPDVENADVGKTADQAADQAGESAHTIREEFEVAGSQLLDAVKKMISDGKVRRLILRTPDNKMVLEMPLLAGVAVGGVLTLASPFLALLGALGSLLAKVKLEVVREKEPPVES